jgi:hypothetical protein
VKGSLAAAITYGPQINLAGICASKSAMRNRGDWARRTTIEALGRQLLELKPDPVVRYRLLRDVLKSHGGALHRARRASYTSRHVANLLTEQRDDGGWGRLHTRDTSLHQRFATTEIAVRRASALGLDMRHPAIKRAADHLSRIIRKQAVPTDRAERGPWELGLILFAASTLALIAPDHRDVRPVRALWAAIASRTFADGHYDPDAEQAAHRELTGATIKGSVLGLDNRYVVSLLASEPRVIDHIPESGWVSWLWSSRRPRRGRTEGAGLRYIDVPLDEVPDRHHLPGLDGWLTSLEITAAFPTGRRLAQPSCGWLWQQRAAHGLWDFGRSSGIGHLPLSEDWRSGERRRIDWSTRVLSLLRSCIDPD